MSAHARRTLTHPRQSRTSAALLTVPTAPTLRTASRRGGVRPQAGAWLGPRRAQLASTPGRTATCRGGAAENLWAEGATYDVALSLGQAEFRQNKYRDAAQHFAFAIATYPPREKTEKLQRTKQFLSAAVKHIGTLHITVDQPGAEVRIDGEPIGTSPLPPNTYVDAGSHAVEARIADHVPAKQDITVAAGAALNVDLKFTGPVLLSGIESASSPPQVGSGLEAQGTTAMPANAPPPDSHKRSVEPRTIALWTGVGVTAVSLGLGVAFAVKASSASDDAKNAGSALGPSGCHSPANMTVCNEVSQSLNKRETANKTANISFAVAGVAAAATTAIFFLWPSRRDEAASGIRVAPIATTSFGGLSMSGNF